MRRVLPVLGLGMSLSLGRRADTGERADDLNDYPTAVRADYVFGCMKANGETRQALERCSCSIDVIASILPYERYVTAETVLSMAQVPGTLGSQFRSTEDCEGRRRRSAPRPGGGPGALLLRCGSCRVSAAVPDGQIAGSAGHSPLNTWPLVSTASTWKVAAPFGR